MYDLLLMEIFQCRYKLGAYRLDSVYSERSALLLDVNAHVSTSQKFGKDVKLVILRSRIVIPHEVFVLHDVRML